MRKALFVILVSTFIFISCDNDDVNDVNPFVGTWENESGIRTVFTETVATAYFANGDLYWTGTYMYTDTHIIIKLDQNLSVESMINSYGETATIFYSFDGKDLLFNYGRLKRIN